MTTNTVPLRSGNSYLSWEVFFMGGASVLTCLASWLFFEDAASTLSISYMAFALAFIVNHPHFAASYTLLYGDFRSRIFKRPEYLWAAVIVPAVLLGCLVTAFATGNATLLGYMFSSMYFFVGWHYSKQVFGCVIVTSVQRKIFYKNWERKILLTSLASIWFVSWSKNQTSDGKFSDYEIVHSAFNLPHWLYVAGLVFMGLAMASVVAMHVRKYVVENVLPSPPGVAAYAALAVWFLPFFLHSGFSYMIPFFHSLQYLCFVWMLKRNEIAFQIKDLRDRAWRVEWVKRIGTYAVTALVLGALFFEFIPKGLDEIFFGPNEAFGRSPYLASILLFINIHHYFIDNVIWKSNNETVKKFLFQAPETLAPTGETLALDIPKKHTA